MEVTSLMRTAMMLLLAQDHFSYCQKAVDAAFPRVDPNRQQHFEYEPLGVSCEGLEGLTGWRVMRRSRGAVTTCSARWSTSTGACRIRNVLQGDTGEYWCEMGPKRSDSVNITVTDGPVILESPVRPVAAGEATTLSRSGKQGPPSLTAAFYKDGRLMETSSSLNFTILSVSKSNEGLYTCSLSGAASRGSWLLVRAEEPRPLQLLSIGVGVSFVALLLLLGILQRWKHRAAPREPPPFQASSSPHADEGHRPSSIAAQLHTRAVYSVPTQMI
ncbi:low affinity immunoglobulin gamma Fc region receptor II-c-like, partial [Pungitius pungitius]|uniref:low affinity immunoglobulin gamma Fc region receptor II-c-like n=1 Tax=Pungitius pungitius TaxID=134920 RepID=UPI002E0DA51B